MENNTTSTAAENAGRTFTQEEVNGIVQGRLAAMKKTAEKEAIAGVEAKEQALKSREMNLLVKEALHDRGMPKELAGVITCTDADDLKMKLDTLAGIYQTEKADSSAAQPVKKVGADPGSIGAGFRVAGTGEPYDPIRAAMGLGKE